MSPNITFRDLLGQRIYGIETPTGFVYLVGEKTFKHESDAVRYIRGESNPVVEAMEAEAADTDAAEPEVKE